MLVPSPTLLAQSPDPASLLEACGTDPTLACRKVLEWTASDLWAGVADFVVGRPLRVLIVLLAAWIASRLARRAVTRAVRRAADPAVVGRLARAGFTRGHRGKQADTPAHRRAEQRAEAIGSVARSAVTTLIWGIAGVTILGELGVSLGPLLASAGIAGVAVGFGAQNLVRDLLSGMFMLAEDQFGVGDIIDVGDATGVVEGITLRTTRIRDIEGTLWHVPNGEIRRVGNKSQEWARALLDVGVAYSTDLDRAAAVIKEVADEVSGDEAWSPDVLGEPEIWGVERLGDSSIAIRLVVKTRPGQQWRVRRELNRRIKARFDREGIEIPFPQHTVWLRGEAPPAPEASPEAAPAPAEA